MKVLFMTNVPSPYRLDFFNELGRYCELTVTFEGRKATDRDDRWVGEKSKSYKPVFLKGKRTNSDQFFCPSILKIIKKGFDHIIVSNYSSPTSLYAMAYMKLHHIPYWIEADGGMISKSENKVKFLLKKRLIGLASHWFSSGHITTQYFVHYGAKKSEIYEYPFTSLRKEDILPSVPTIEEKIAIRKKLGIKGGDKVILTVGRFSYNRGYGKGYDILLKAISLCPEDYYLYIVGDEPTQEFIELRKKMGLINKVKFIGFKDKEELKEYYMAADLFCLQTRGDVWGLVINEAMSMALPVITTNQCVAGLELVKRNRNGFIVDPEDYQELSKDIKIILRNNEKKASMALESLKIISNYSITEMVLSHIKAFNSV